jgi:hypothetical protein
MARILEAVSSMAGCEVPVHFKVVVSEEYEAVDEERPHALSIQDVCVDAMTGVFCRSKAGAGGSTVVCVRIEDDHPVVEEFELSLRIAAGGGIWHGTTLVMTAQFAVAYFQLLSQVVVV